MRRLTSLLPGVCLAGVLIIAGCGGGGPTNPGDDGDSNNGNNSGNAAMSATIDGQAWSASTAQGSATALQFAPLTGGYIIIGVGSGPVSGLSFTVNFITKTGTYPLGVDGATVPGGFAGLTGGSGASGGTWLTPLDGAAGTLTITALTTTRIAGTFSFTSKAAGGGATGTKVVTNGQFDVPLGHTSPIAVLTDSMGSKISASMNGQSWNAAIASGQTSTTHLSLAGINSNYALSMTIPRPSAPGVYTLSNNSGSLLWVTDPNAVAPAGTRCCYGIAGDVGTLTITSMTTTRIKGSFSASMRPQPGTAATGILTIANGTFDIGLYHTP